MPTTQELIDRAFALISTSYEYTPEDFDALLASFVEESGDKLAALRAVAKAADATAATHRAEADAHHRRAKAEAAKADRCKERAYALLSAMRDAGEDPKVKGVARLQANGGKLPLVYAPDFAAADLPPAMQRVVVEADTDAIRLMLDNGLPVRGVTLGPRGEGVRWE